MKNRGYRVRVIYALKRVLMTVTGLFTVASVMRQSRSTELASIGIASTKVLSKEPSDLIAVTMAKNKGIYFPEWIEFHLLHGFGRFIIYDHKSTDDTRKILEPYINQGTVEYVSW